ncbi:MAG: bifunctional metallophosphatase/5'-nucleotidase [Clostridiales bacterium]|nr:bifunctional metallophosphatase/5'-nucleotidase [Clostridiales bacterium]
MKKFLALLLSVMMLLGCVAMAEEAPAGLTKNVVVLFTSDAHAGIDMGWGYAGVAAIRDAIGAKNHVVLVDNGDAIQGETIGTLTNGKAIVELMNVVGYDVAVPGNHEFDYGMSNFLTLAGEVAQYPYVSANFTYQDKTVFNPYVIKEFDGVKIAFVGVTTPKTITSSTPAYFQDENGNFVYGFCQDETGAKFYAAIQSAVDAARAEGAQYVIICGHLGTEETCEPYTSIDVIYNVSGIDAVLDGHAHETMPSNIVKGKDGKDVVRVACGTKLANVGALTITPDGTISAELYTWQNSITPAETFGLTGPVVDAVNEKIASLDEIRNTVVARTENTLYINDPETDVRIIRNAETNLGDLCADAYRAMSGSDVAFVNGGGVRAQIPAGDITLDQIYSVHPFGNIMCMVEVTGQQILDALEFGARNNPGENGGFLHVSGLTYEIHTYVPSTAKVDENGMFAGVEGEYRVKNVVVGGEPLDVNKTYTLASHNYMLKNSGDGFSMFAGSKLLIDETLIDNQVLITYITVNLGGVVGEEYANPYGQGRIIGVPEAPAQ